MYFIFGILTVLITVFAIQVLFILTCDYIDLKTLLILMLLHMSGSALSILSLNNSSIILKYLVFLLTIAIIFLSNIFTRNHYKKFKEKRRP